MKILAAIKKSFAGERASNALCTAVYAAIALVYLYILRYIVPSADDYANSLDVRHYMKDVGYGQLRATWQMMVDGYMNNQGTWFSSFLDFFPLSFESLYSYWSLRLFMLAADVLFFYAVWRLIRVLCGRWITVSYGPLLLAVTITAMNHASPKETLLWMNGACVYTIPFAVMLLGLSLYIEWLGSSRTGRLIAACCLSFLSTGGSLTLAGFLSAAALSVLICEGLRTRHVRVGQVVYLAVVVAGALINTLAPGNFSRHTSYVEDGTLTYAESLVNTFIIMHERIAVLAMRGFLPAAAVAVVVVCCLWVRRENLNGAVSSEAGGINGAADLCGFGGFDSLVEPKTNPLLMAICVYGCFYATFFPAVLGFNLTPENNEIDVRLQFTTGWLLSLGILLWLAYTVLWVRARLAARSSESAKTGFGKSISETDDDFSTEPHATRLKAPLRRVIAVVLCLAVGCVNFAALYDPYESDMYMLVLARELRSNTLYEVYAAQRAALERIKTAEEIDVYITFYVPESQILKSLGLTEFPLWWVNQVTAYFYGKNSVFYWPPTLFQDSSE